ncbi:MAG TPA: hypothetical protein VGU74_12275, partial [Gemmatimonadales bacterium]|nr:hypothetical protein [Gemmatimonadales bacterium]
MKRSHHSAVTLVAFVAACSPKQQAAAPPPHVVTITATDYAFAAADTIPAGLTTVRMVNQGHEVHQAVLYSAPGKTFAELEAVAAPQGPVPEWWHAFLAIQPTFPGGAGEVVPGDTSVITVNLTPGNYVIACFIPSPDGKWHVQKGMHRRLVVAPAAGATAPAAADPKSDLTVTLSDYAFNISAPVTAGTHTIRVENSGPQVHELAVERLAPGKTLADWQRWAQGGMKG